MAKDLICRSAELKALREYYDSERSEFIALYERRRVGKSFLIRKSVDDDFSFYVTGMHGATKSEQLANFAIALQRYSGSERLSIPKNGLLSNIGFEKILISRSYESEENARMMKLLIKLAYLCLCLMALSACSKSDDVIDFDAPLRANQIRYTLVEGCETLPGEAFWRKVGLEVEDVKYEGNRGLVTFGENVIELPDGRCA